MISALDSSTVNCFDRSVLASAFWDPPALVHNLWYKWRYPDPEPTLPLADIAASLHGSAEDVIRQSIQRHVYRDLVDSDPSGVTFL